LIANSIFKYNFKRFFRSTIKLPTHLCPLLYFSYSYI